MIADGDEGNAGFIDQDGIGFVDDDCVEGTVHLFGDIEGDLISEEIEA